ncbi:hypothetical protein LTR53_000073 [Teratosphaeriaceae sp. CCFEE 6253]|nr:hypothetical protein LTR53_000073 [Teratosphaeriaceae sp. CCFEE 6253]
MVQDKFLNSTQYRETYAPLGEHVAAGLKDLFNRPRYRRVWMRQEIWAARAVSVVLGRHSMSWDHLRKTVRVLQRLRHGLSNPLDGLIRASPTQQWFAAQGDVCRSSDMQMSQREWEDVDLLSVLQRAARSKCSGLRDHVYGVLGMSSANYNEAYPNTATSGVFLVVDYTKPVSQVYQDAVMYLLQRDANLSFLFLDAEYVGTVHDECLPSWCPNWSVKCEKQSELFRPLPPLPSGLSDEQSTSTFRYDFLSMPSNFGILCVEGAIIAELSPFTRVSETAPCRIHERLLGRFLSYMRWGMNTFEKIAGTVEISGITNITWETTTKSSPRQGVVVLANGGLLPLVLTPESRDGYLFKGFVSDKYFRGGAIAQGFFQWSQVNLDAREIQLFDVV